MHDSVLSREIKGQEPDWKPQSGVAEDVHRAGSAFIEELANQCPRQQQGGCDNSSTSQVDGHDYKINVNCQLDGRPCFLQTLEFDEIAILFAGTLRRIEFGDYE